MFSEEIKAASDHRSRETDNSSPQPSDGRKSVLQESCDSRMNIILELSSKVSDQDAKITALENQIREKNKLIQQLQGEQRAQSGKNRRGSQGGNTRHVNSGLSSTHNGVRHDKQHREMDDRSFNTCDDNMSEVSELKSIQNEMKDLMRKNKKKNPKKKPQYHIDTMDYRQSSSISRDSGIASAGVNTGERNLPQSSGRNPKPIRVSSAASTISISGFSDDLNDYEPNSILNSNANPRDSERSERFQSNATARTNLEFDDNDSWADSGDEKLMDEDISPRRLELRQISAPKKKKSQKHDFEYIDNLLSGTPDTTA